MAYRVSLAAPAEADAYVAFERIRAAAPRHAEKWLTRLFEAIFSLDSLPARCPVIPESKELGYPARHLLYGKGNGVYRIDRSPFSDDVGQPAGKNSEICGGYPPTPK